MKNITEEIIDLHTDDEGVKEVIRPEKMQDDENSISCQIRRKIEDYLERRRYKDELGNEEEIDLA